MKKRWGLFIFAVAALVCTIAAVLSLCTKESAAVSAPDMTVLIQEEICMDPLLSCTSPETEPPLPSPGIELLQGSSIDWMCGRPYIEPGYTAWDSHGNELTERVCIEGEICCWKTGDYELHYSCIDDEGNSYSATRLVSVQPQALPQTVQQENTIYLSFDDGPCAHTEFVLDLLDQYNAKATFFVIVSEGRSNLGLITEIHKRGHRVGIHCGDHDYGRLYASEEVFFEDFMKAQQLVFELTGEYADVSRFPGGSVTAWALLGRKTDGGFDTIKLRLSEMGIRYYDWNVKIEGDGSSALDVFSRFVQQVPKHDSPICLQHDTRIYSIKALEEMLRWGTEQGYTFSSIDLTTPEIHSY